MSVTCQECGDQIFSDAERRQDARGRAYHVECWASSDAALYGEVCRERDEARQDLAGVRALSVDRVHENARLRALLVECRPEIESAIAAYGHTTRMARAMADLLARLDAALKEGA